MLDIAKKICDITVNKIFIQLWW